MAVQLPTISVLHSLPIPSHPILVVLRLSPTIPALGTAVSLCLMQKAWAEISFSLAEMGPHFTATSSYHA